MVAITLILLPLFAASSVTASDLDLQKPASKPVRLSSASRRRRAFSESASDLDSEPPAGKPVRVSLASRSERRHRIHHSKGASASASNPRLNSTVIRRSLEELEISKQARNQAAASFWNAKTRQQDLVAMMSTDRAEKAYLKVKPMLPKARAELLEVRRYEAETKMYLRHVLDVVHASRHISDTAAEHALAAAKGWIWSDAKKAAEKSGKVDNRIDRLAGAVAAAAEPYHLALLRNQKFCAETYSKAKSASENSVKLLEDAKKVALKAQGMQASGLGLEASETKAMANTMSVQAEEMRQWSGKLYNYASTACASTAGYQAQEQQAAAAAAVNTVMNAPMKLPAMKSSMDWRD